NLRRRAPTGLQPVPFSHSGTPPDSAGPLLWRSCELCGFTVACQDKPRKTAAAAVPSSEPAAVAQESLNCAAIIGSGMGKGKQFRRPSAPPSSPDSTVTAGGVGSPY